MVWNIFYFPFHIWDVILPIDELIFFKMVIAPPTRYINHYYCMNLHGPPWNRQPPPWTIPLWGRGHGPAIDGEMWSLGALERIGRIGIRRRRQNWEIEPFRKPVVFFSQQFLEDYGIVMVSMILFDIIIPYLVDGLEHEFYFSIIYGIILPNWLIFFRGLKPPISI